MSVQFFPEAGYELAALAVAAAEDVSVDRAKELLPKMAWGKPGERDFLDAVFAWMAIEATPRFWRELEAYDYNGASFGSPKGGAADLVRRIVCLPYSTLQTIAVQRRRDPFREWREFVAEVLDGVEHPEFLETAGERLRRVTMSARQQ